MQSRGGMTVSECMGHREAAVSSDTGELDGAMILEGLDNRV